MLLFIVCGTVIAACVILAIIITAVVCYVRQKSNDHPQQQSHTNGSYRWHIYERPMEISLPEIRQRDQFSDYSRRLERPSSIFPSDEPLPTVDPGGQLVRRQNTLSIYPTDPSHLYMNI